MKYEDLKIGQKVKVVRAWADYADGWGSSWAKLMDKYINNGIEYTILDFESYGVSFKEDLNYTFPWQSLELAQDVEEQKEIQNTVEDINEINTITTQVSIFRKNQNPIFGDGVTHIRIDDEAAGPFIVLSQNDHEIRLDKDGIQVVADAAIKLLNDSKKYFKE